MSPIGESERTTQSRVLALFRDEIGYRYLGDWTERSSNSNIEDELLTAYLERKGYSTAQIGAALYKLRSEADNPNRSLYENNREVYRLLRYGVPVRVEIGQVTETIKLIDWAHPEQNDFAIAEEVTLRGERSRRPDLVLYVNGIAVGVIELKSSRVSIGDGIRQLLSNQKPEFHAWFFSTVQIVFAGSDSEGMRYGAIGTPEKHFQAWKEDVEDNTRSKLDKYLLKMCAKERLIELMYDFVLFDGGVKKLPRPHQYFGVKAAQRHASAYKGGILWHTQGSGKSIVMVLLAKWILENNPKARVAIVTDRDELDKQIEGVFADAGEIIVRTSSGRELMSLLGQPSPRLLCSLIHKFGRRDVADFEQFMKELQAQPSTAVGELFVFVDECHRTQSGKLRKTMKALLPSAVFIGFTGTPLLKDDKETSLEVFGGYIHTYKFSEAVADGVVLNLVYEARNIEQELGSQDRIDAWFDAKTRGLNDWKRAELKRQWGTMQRVLSSRSRMERVVEDIIFDFGVKPRLVSERGNAILVASSIYEACRYFKLFQESSLRGKCAVVTSYNPQASDVTREETGAGTDTEMQFLYNTYTALLATVDAQPGKTKTETYEDNAKKLFKGAPAEMKLLIVVDKLLTGYDAPPCTYLYIDKFMQDHGLFQAICRTNRLDGEDKEFGYIVDYKNLFKKLINDKGTGALQVYSSELDCTAEGPDPQVLVQERLAKGRERLDAAFEAILLLCEPVEPPRGDLEHIHYFCGNTEKADDLSEREPLRVALYKATAAFVRAYAAISDQLESAGYQPAEVSRLKRAVEEYLKLRDIIRNASGESLDLKAYEADMRYLIDTYIEAGAARTISTFGDVPLLQLIAGKGMGAALDTLPPAIKGDKAAVAETIENNVRTTIIREHATDPALFDRMSKLLAEIIAKRKRDAIDYEAYLRSIEDLVRGLQSRQVGGLPPSLHSRARIALYNNLGGDELLAIRVDEAVRRARPDGWRGVRARENVIKSALYSVLHDEQEVERIFGIVLAQDEY